MTISGHMLARSLTACAARKEVLLSLDRSAEKASGSTASTARFLCSSVRRALLFHGFLRLCVPDSMPTRLAKFRHRTDRMEVMASVWPPSLSGW
jgi:hypothetical protein